LSDYLQKTTKHFADVAMFGRIGILS